MLQGISFCCPDVPEPHRDAGQDNLQSREHWMGMWWEWLAAWRSLISTGSGGIVVSFWLWCCWGTRCGHQWWIHLGSWCCWCLPLWILLLAVMSSQITNLIIVGSWLSSGWAQWTAGYVLSPGGHLCSVWWFLMFCCLSEHPVHVVRKSRIHLQNEMVKPVQRDNCVECQAESQRRAVWHTCPYCPGGRGPSAGRWHHQWNWDNTQAVGGLLRWGW